MTAMAEQIPQALAATTGPGGLVPVAFLGRTSSERLQDPVASMRRQVRNATAWLPAGCQIVSYYWDVETGGLDLEDRGLGDPSQIAAAAGIARDGGLADLLAEAKSPAPAFAFVVGEDIERSARDMYSSLKLERELQNEGIPLFATDEPFSVEGINATTRPGPPRETRRRRMVPAPIERQSLGRAAGAFPGRVEPGQSPHRLPRGKTPPPQPDQSI
jgi:hypothetical protein